MEQLVELELLASQEQLVRRVKVVPLVRMVQPDQLD